MPRANLGYSTQRTWLETQNANTSQAPATPSFTHMPPRPSGQAGTPTFTPAVGISPEEWYMEQQQILRQAYENWAREVRLAEVRANLSFTETPPAPSNPVAQAFASQTATRPLSGTTNQSGNPPGPGYNRSADEDLTKPYRPEAFAEKSKFTLRIAQAEFPAKTKMPSTVGKYDGSGDPDDYLNGFYTAGGVEGWTLSVWCHMFVQTLTGAARACTSASNAHTKDAGDIMYIRRRDNESIEDFITRYNKEALQIGGVSEDLMKVGFTQGARSEELIRCLRGRDGMPKTWSEIMTASKIFARTEKALSNQRVTEKKERGDVGHAAAKTSDKRPRDQGIWSRIQPRSFTPNERQHTESRYSNPRDGQQVRNRINTWTLSKSPSQVLLTETIDLVQPKPLNPKSSKNPKKLCEFHKDISHDTDDFIQLRRQIEAVVKTGKLAHLLKDLRTVPTRRTKSKKKVRQRKNGSSTDIMYEQCFRQLNVEDQRGMIDFLVLPINSKHNVILGREALATFNAIPSTAHGAIGFPTPTGIAIIWSNRECATTEGFRPAKSLKPSETPMPEKWVLNPNFPEQPITNDTTISHSTREHLKQLLIKYAGVFAWQPSDMQGVPRTMAEHRLQTYKAVKPIAQKRRNIGGERSKDLEKQVKELLKAGIIRKGYHQIQMAIEDEDKIAFRTNIDDLVIKSKEEETMIKDITEIFERLRSMNMKLNPAKCSFGVEEGKFMGVMVTKDVFRPNPEKVLAIARMPSPSSLKEVQTLNGRQVAINRFLANHAAKALPFITSLKNWLKKSQFKWTEKAESAFQEMKNYLMNLPTLTTPMPGETLILYLSASEGAMGVVLLVKRKGVQAPVYYVSRVLTGPKTRYSTLEKLVLVLGNEFTYAIRLEFKSTNNEAEYEALLAGLRIAKKMGAKHIEARVDSLLIAGQPPGKRSTSRGPKHTIGPVKTSKCDPNRSKVMDDPYSELPQHRNSTGRENTSKESAAQGAALSATRRPRMIVAKIMNTGYYWPGMHMDAVKELRKCKACQRHAPRTISPKNNLIPVSTTWPFQKWATDIVGPFQKAPGQVERANRSIVDGIKARLDQWGHSWVEELPHVLWAYRTSPKTSNGETPFSLTYGSKAVIPTEIGVPSTRFLMASKNDNSQEIHINLDLLDERREEAALKESIYKKKLEKY
ncbi:hypothetical protein L1987_23880 [Smallanthus sonchifolius]|uniref:Uncharacterized protein n=1 Tax=Smallanthus sonchifolius TaxID=185202 RepID=A0ACB9ILJ3_9ASTR|nr:hypothetical protein L1987_23880 [Smallanthus sonchifolius]